MSLVALSNVYSGGTIEAAQKHRVLKTTAVSTTAAPQTAMMHVGTKCADTLIGINLQWNSFLKNFWPSGQHDVPEDMLLNIVSQMFKLPQSNIHTAQATIDEMCIMGRLNPQKLVNALVKSMGLHESIEWAVRHLFTTWRIHLERMVTLFAEKTLGEKAFATLMHKWKTIDKAYGIGSSSLVLLALSPPGKPSDLPWLSMPVGAKPRAHGKRLDKWEIEVPRIPTTRTLEAALASWTYPGYCPCKPIQRLLTLLSFPANELQVELQRLEIAIPTMPLREFTKLRQVSLPEGLKLTIMPITTECKSAAHDTPSEALRRSVDNLLALFGNLKEYLVEHEQYYTRIARAIADLNTIVARSFK